MFGVIKFTYISSPNTLASQEDCNSSSALQNAVRENPMVPLFCIDKSWSKLTYSRVNKQFSEPRRNYGTV